MPNFVDDFLTGMQAGQKMAAFRQRQDALALYQKSPDAGINAMALVDPGDANELLKLQGAQRTNQARTSAAPYVAKHDWKGAAAVWANADPDTAGKFMQMSTNEVETNAKQLERVGGIFTGVSSIPVTGPDGQPNPDALRLRTQLVASHLAEMKPWLDEANLTPDQVMQMPWGDDRWLNATSLSLMGAKDATTQLLAQRKAETDAADKAADNARQDRQVAETQRHNRADEANQSTRTNYLGQQVGLEGRRTADQERRTGLQASRDAQPNTNREIGAVLQKMRAGQPLTAGEQQIFDSWKNKGTDPLLYGGGQPQPQAPAPAASAPRPAAKSSGPPRLSTRAQVAALKPGSVFIWTDGKPHTRK